MKTKNIPYFLGIIILLLGGTISLIGKTSEFYYPLIYLAVGLAISAVILIIKELVKKTK